MAAKKKKEENEASVENSTVTSASVYSKDGGHIRTYTKEVHGDEFVDLAKQTAEQHHGSRIEHH